MIIYGYHFDLDKLPRNLQRLLENTNHFETCYTTGAGKFSAAVLGIGLDHSSCLFYPIALDEVTTKPSEAAELLLKEIWESLPEELRAKAENKEPKVFMFENNDD